MSRCASATRQSLESPPSDQALLALSASREAKSRATRRISPALHWIASLSRAVTIPTEWTGKTSASRAPASYSALNPSSRGTNR